MATAPDRKIGVLTFHRVINDGSVLQAVCLCRMLQRKYPDATVELIDYRPRSLLWLNLRRVAAKGRPRRAWFEWSRLRATSRFISRHAKLSPRFTSDDLSTSQQWVESQGYSKIVVGSDTVWMLQRLAGFPAPPTLYYEPVRNTRTTLIAFAVSADPLLPVIGQSTAARHSLARALTKYEHIGYRDDVTGDLLRSLSPADSSRMSGCADPTFGVPLREAFSLGPPALPARTLGLSIRQCSRTLLLQLATAARQHGYRVADLTNRIGSDSGVPAFPASTLDRVRMIGALDALITDRFHTSIFQARLRAGRMLFVENAAKWPLANSKGRDLYCKLGIPDNVVRLGHHGFESQDTGALMGRFFGADWPAPKPAGLEDLCRSAADQWL